MATKCPDCGSFNQTHASACRKCGADLNPRTTAATAVGSARDKPPIPWYKRLLGRRK
jgi:uncharacterized membrane protein YvbJ